MSNKPHSPQAVKRLIRMIRRHLRVINKVYYKQYHKRKIENKSLFTKLHFSVIIVGKMQIEKKIIELQSKL
jgi:hypothetical protein